MTAHAKHLAERQESSPCLALKEVSHVSSLSSKTVSPLFVVSHKYRGDVKILEPVTHLEARPKAHTG